MKRHVRRSLSDSEMLNDIAEEDQPPPETSRVSKRGEAWRKVFQKDKKTDKKADDRSPSGDPVHLINITPESFSKSTTIVSSTLNVSITKFLVI